MSIYHGLNISGSALTAQRIRMDTASSNLANADTTRATQVDGEWQPYRRKMVVMEPIDGSFNDYLQRATNRTNSPGKGVQVSQIVSDPSPFKVVYQPNHPDANEEGYVEMPNVDPLKEMTDLISSTRSYEANVTALNATKGMLMKALQIGQ
jgi:flagellar basal-body rod protein FlgC